MRHIETIKINHTIINIYQYGANVRAIYNDIILQFYDYVNCIAYLKYHASEF